MSVVLAPETSANFYTLPIQAEPDSPKAPHSGQRMHLLLHCRMLSSPYIHWQPCSVLCHHVTTHCSAVAVLLSIHRLRIVAPDLCTGNPAASPIFARTMGRTNERSGCAVLHLVILLELLAAGNSCHCIRLQLGISHLRCRPAGLDGVLCFPGETQVLWACDCSRRQECACRIGA